MLLRRVLWTSRGLATWLSLAMWSPHSSWSVNMLQRLQRLQTALQQGGFSAQCCSNERQSR